MTKVHLLDRLPLPPIKPVLISPEHAAVVRPLVGKPKICKTAASLDGGGDKNRETTHDTPKNKENNRRPGQCGKDHECWKGFVRLGIMV